MKRCKYVLFSFQIIFTRKKENIKTELCLFFMLCGVDVCVVASLHRCVVRTQTIISL